FDVTGSLFAVFLWRQTSDGIQYDVVEIRMVN
ncbi:Hypothetical protein, partial CDS, partial [Neorhizobium galegae bv. officinalis]